MSEHVIGTENNNPLSDNEGFKERIRKLVSDHRHLPNKTNFVPEPIIAGVGEQKDDRDKYWQQFSSPAHLPPVPPMEPGTAKKFSDTLAACVQLGSLELLPTEFVTTGTFNVNVPPFKLSLDYGAVSEVMRQALYEFVGQKLTRDMMDQMARKAVLALNDLMFPQDMTLNGMKISRGTQGPLQEIGLDWKREQQLIAEEQRYMDEVQAQMNSKINLKPYVGTPKSGENTLEKMWKEGLVEYEKREKMREDKFYRQIKEPIKITDDELDRSVPTNLPVDPAKDTPYQKFRRAHNLADTTEAMATFCSFARMHNLSAPGAGDPIIPEEHITTIEQLVFQAKLSAKHTDPADFTTEEKHAVLKNGWSDTTEYVKRDGFIQEFFAYETVGAVPAHVGSLVKTDDPALMEALFKAEQEGRIDYDEHGSIKEIREAPNEAGMITVHTYNPDGSETVSMVFPDCQKVPDPKSVFDKLADAPTAGSDPVVDFTRKLMKSDGEVTQALNKLRDDDDDFVEPVIAVYKK